MTSVLPSCPKCRNSLPGAYCNVPDLVACPACGARLFFEVFPAMFQSREVGAAAEPVIEEGTASCFYHEHKKAVRHCDSCGRFMCALCDVEFQGRHICPACLQAGKKKGKLATLDSSRTLWDSAALTVAVLLCWTGPITFGTGLVAITLAVMSFFKPGSLIPRWPWRAVTAILVAFISIAFWVYLFFLKDSH